MKIKKRKKNWLDAAFEGAAKKIVDHVGEKLAEKVGNWVEGMGKAQPQQPTPVVDPKSETRNPKPESIHVSLFQAPAQIIITPKRRKREPKTRPERKNLPRGKIVDADFTVKK